MIPRVLPRVVAGLSIVILVRCGSDGPAPPPGAGDAAGDADADAFADGGRGDGGARLDASEDGDAAAGTDAHAADADAAPGGGRLRTQVYTAPDSAGVFKALYDSERGETCSFVQTGEEDGEPVFHCINAKAISLAFLDDECTEPVAAMRPPCLTELEEGEPVIGPRPESPGCGQVLEFFSAGAPTEADTLYAVDSGSCMPAPHYEDRDLYEVGPLDLSQFVRGTLKTTTVDADAELDVISIQDADGTGMFLRMEVAGAPCHEEPISEGVLACQPDGASHFASNGLYADADCSTRVATAAKTVGCSMDPAPTPRFAFYYEDVDSCARLTGVFDVGDTVNTVYGEEASCSEVTASEMRNYYELGEELGLDALPRYNEVWQGTGRLRAVQYGWPGEVAFRDSAMFYDTELDSPCYPREAGDGAVRCFPPERFTVEGQYFSDDECTEALRTLAVGGCNDPLGADDLHYEREEGLCSATVVSAHRLAEHTGDVYSDSEGACAAVATGAPELTGVALVTVGEEVLLADFVELETEVR